MPQLSRHTPLILSGGGGGCGVTVKIAGVALDGSSCRSATINPITAVSAVAIAAIVPAMVSHQLCCLGSSGMELAPVGEWSLRRQPPACFVAKAGGGCKGGRDPPFLPRSGGELESGAIRDKFVHPIGERRARD